MVCKALLLTGFPKSPNIDSIVIVFPKYLFLYFLFHFITIFVPKLFVLAGFGTLKVAKVRVQIPQGALVVFLSKTFYLLCLAWVGGGVVGKWT